MDRVYHTDAAGTVQALTGPGEAVETRYVLNAWGEATAGAAAGNPYVYHGGLGYWQEPGLGLEYVRARWLDAARGGWLSVDPVEGEPRYGYASNNPLRYVDPSGTQAAPARGAFGIYAPYVTHTTPFQLEALDVLASALDWLANLAEQPWRNAAFACYDLQRSFALTLAHWGPLQQLFRDLAGSESSRACSGCCRPSSGGSSRRTR